MFKQDRFVLRHAIISDLLWVCQTGGSYSAYLKMICNGHFKLLRVRFFFRRVYIFGVFRYNFKLWRAKIKISLPFKLFSRICKT